MVLFCLLKQRGAGKFERSPQIKFSGDGQAAKLLGQCRSFFFRVCLNSIHKSPQLSAISPEINSHNSLILQLSHNTLVI